MKVNYKNWMPFKTVLAVEVAALISTFIWFMILFTDVMPELLRTFFGILFMVTSFTLIGAFCFCCAWYNYFSYEGKHKFEKKIIDGVSDYVKVPENGKCLDVGCGSGALAIAVAKKNSTAHVTGVDKWGVHYCSYSQRLCQDNALAEGVAERCDFTPSLAQELNFPDESFDVVTSNLCYSNVRGFDKQELIRESLRVLKPGGTFVIHDTMAAFRYGNMEEFCQELLAQGYKNVELISTMGLLMTSNEETWLGLDEAKLLMGTK